MLSTAELQYRYVPSASTSHIHSPVLSAICLKRSSLLRRASSEASCGQRSRNAILHSTFSVFGALFDTFLKVVLIFLIQQVLFLLQREVFNEKPLDIFGPSF